jgi:hypothetical protein
VQFSQLSIKFRPDIVPFLGGSKVGF